MKNISINPEDYTILAVDDIATNIMLLKAVLSRAKYKIVTASGGNEALEKAAKESPDLIPVSYTHLTLPTNREV